MKGREMPKAENFLSKAGHFQRALRSDASTNPFADGLQKPHNYGQEGS